MGDKMSHGPRPRIAVLGRFTESASAIRYKGVLSARELLELVWAAGGEPIQYLPVQGPARDWDREISRVEGVLLPGGGDIDPSLYGGTQRPEVYDVDPLQDAEDLRIARVAIDAGIPILGVCRVLHVLNVSRGGSLIEHMPEPHRHMLQTLTIPASADLGVSGPLEVSCFHHQAIKELGEGIEVTVRANDGTIEAVSVTARGWCRGIQWHPEDTWRSDSAQLDLMKEFIRQAQD
jgi:putative glutamine amidotransferase